MNRCVVCGQETGTLFVDADGVIRCSECHTMAHCYGVWNEPSSPLQSVIHWIPVSERLPEDTDDRLVVGHYRAGKHRHINVGWYRDGTWYGPIPYPRYWAELPTPPASEDGEG